MTYATSVTKKFQMTLPKEVRNALNVAPGQKRITVIDAKRGIIRIDPVPDIMSISGMFKAPKGKNALKAREYMEKHYEPA